MKKNWIRIMGCLLMLCMMTAALTGCSSNAAESNARIAWAAAGRTDTPSAVYYMHFKGSDSMNTTVAQPDAAVALVPDSGYAYLIPPRQDAVSSFGGLTLVYVNDAGKLVSVLNYDALYGTFEMSGISPYLEAANYVAALYVDCLNGTTPAAKDERLSQWYTFSQNQVKNMMK